MLEITFTHRSHLFTRVILQWSHPLVHSSSGAYRRIRSVDEHPTNLRNLIHFHFSGCIEGRGLLKMWFVPH